LPHLCVFLFSCWKVSQAPKSGDGSGWVRLVQCLVFCSAAKRFCKLWRMGDGTGWVRVVQCSVFCSVAEKVSQALKNGWWYRMWQRSVMLLLHYKCIKERRNKRERRAWDDGTYLVETTSGSRRFWSRFLCDLWLMWVPFCGNLALEWVPALAIRNCELHSPMKYERFFLALLMY
jgi:hypothetical protein